MRPFSLLIFLTLSLFAGAQQPVHSILVEYAYSGLPDDEAMQIMYGNSKKRLYCDSNYLMFEQLQDLPEEYVAEHGAGLNITIVKDQHTGALFICMQYDTLRVRMQEDAAKAADLDAQLTQMPDFAKPVVQPANQNVLDYSCLVLDLPTESGDTNVVYLTPALRPAGNPKHFPFYFQFPGVEPGFMLGKDEDMGDFTLHLRATRVVVDQPEDVPARLAGFRLVTKEEGNRQLQAMMMRNMGIKD